MGEARLRGSFEKRLADAIGALRIKQKYRNSSGGYFVTGNHRNSGIYGRKPHRLNRPWKRRAAGK